MTFSTKPVLFRSGTCRFLSMLAGPAASDQDATVRDVGVQEVAIIPSVRVNCPNLVTPGGGNALCGQTVLDMPHDLLSCGEREMAIIRKLILGTASVLALGIGGAALDYVADADDAVPSAEGVMPSTPEASPHWIDSTNLSKDDVRWAQVELRNLGLYNDSLDGVIGPETKRALAEFQKANGLKQTATLDQQTADALIGNIGIGQGSSVPPKAPGARPMTNSSGTSDFGDHNVPK